MRVVHESWPNEMRSFLIQTNQHRAFNRRIWEKAYYNIDMPPDRGQMQRCVALVCKIRAFETPAVVLHNALDQQDVVLDNGTSKTYGHIELDPVLSVSPSQLYFLDGYAHSDFMF